jgi:predicted alpha/beta hydrolase family esterase
MMRLGSKSYFECSIVIVFVAFLLSNCGTAPSPQSSTEGLPGILVGIDTRPGITIESLIIEPAQPAAAVLFLKGGKGVFGFEKDAGNIKAKQGQGIIDGLAKNMTAKGIIVVAVDAPSDKANGFNFTFRTREAHLKDIEAVVRYVKSRYEVPAWLFGHSAGTLSAAGMGVHFPKEIAGLILAAPVTEMVAKWGDIYDTHPNGILDMDLGRITAPVLIVYHRDDRCVGAPPANVPRLVAAINGSDAVEIRDGKGYKGNPCGPFSAHAFYGVENEFFETVDQYIVSQK